MASDIGKTGSENGKSSWMFGAVTGFVFIIGAASSAMGVWNGISAKAATAPQVAPVQASAAGAADRGQGRPGRTSAQTRAQPGAAAGSGIRAGARTVDGGTGGGA